MNFIQMHKDYLSGLSREELESLALGMSTIASCESNSIIKARLLVGLDPSAFKEGTLEGVKVALKYIDIIGTRILVAERAKEKN